MLGSEKKSRVRAPKKSKVEKMEVSQERRAFCKDSARFLSGVALASVLPNLKIEAKAFANAKIPTVTLNNGVKMPALGLGTLKIGNDTEVQRAVEEALELGYRLFDTAQSYQTEKGVGFALRATGVKREEIFITTNFQGFCGGK